MRGNAEPFVLVPTVDEDDTLKALDARIAKLEADRERLTGDLHEAWQVLAEAVQTILRASGGREPYELLKRLTRGRRLDADVYRALLDELDLAPAIRDKLAALSPADYTGLAADLARAVLGDES